MHSCLIVGLQKPPTPSIRKNKYDVSFFSLRFTLLIDDKTHLKQTVGSVLSLSVAKVEYENVSLFIKILNAVLVFIYHTTASVDAYHAVHRVGRVLRFFLKVPSGQIGSA